MSLLPRDNILSTFSSCTYIASLYAGPLEYFTRLAAGERTVAGLSLIAQNGGAPARGQASANGNLTAERSEFFDLDFYIDDIEIKSLVSTQETGSPSLSYEMRFKVIEPYGITFLDRLEKEVQKLGSGDPSYWSQPYLLVIRFYGFDKNGKPIRGISSNTSDSAAAIEKYIPFKFQEIKFKVNGNTVEYQCAGVPEWSYYAQGGLTGAVPIPLELSASTVGQLLAGTGSSTPAANVRSLTDAINGYYKSLAPGGTRTNEIAIEFADPAIANAVLKRPGPTALDATPANMTTEADRILPEKGQVQTNDRNFSVAAGTPIIQFIDTIVRASSYISDQQAYDITETGEVIIKPNVNEVAKWFLVGGRTELTFDQAQNSTLYKTTYVVRPYEVYLNTGSMPKTAYKGPHKRYDYWFTGQNKEVLSFEQEYNFLYFTRMAPAEAKNAINNIGSPTASIVTPGANVSSQGARNGAADPAAFYAANLYSLADQAEVRLVIHGDPDWLGEATVGGSEMMPFTSNGAVNFEAGHVMFEVSFNVPVDYNMRTGLMDVNQANTGRTSNFPGVRINTFVYNARVVTSMFKNGQFTQELIGWLRLSDNEVQKDSTVNSQVRPPDVQQATSSSITNISAPTPITGSNFYGSNALNPNLVQFDSPQQTQVASNGNSAFGPTTTVTVVLSNGQQRQVSTTAELLKLRQDYPTLLNDREFSTALTRLGT